MVLLELYEIAQALNGGSFSGDPRRRMIDALNVPFVAERLASGGVERMNSVRRGLKQVELEEKELLHALGDVTEAGLAAPLNQYGL